MLLETFTYELGGFRLMRQHMLWEFGLAKDEENMWEAELTKHETSTSFTCPSGAKNLFLL